MTTLCDKLQPLLQTSELGRTCTFKATTASTNLDAATAAQVGARHGTIIVADSQSGGRGRMARNWHSPAGCNLYLSIVMRPDIEIASVPSLPLVVGLAVTEALKNVAPGLGIGFKWPNDLLLNERKLCGILCEMQMEGNRVGHIIVGIGLNLNLSLTDLPDELHARAASLYLATGRRYSRSTVLAEILNHLEPLYLSWLERGLQPLLERLRQYDLLLNRSITVDYSGAPLSGVAVGIAADGALLLKSNGAITSLYSGETHIGSL